MKLKNSHHPYSLITIFFWSLAYVFTRAALEHFSPFALGFLRYAVASIALVIVLLCKKIGLPRLRDLPMFALSGSIGFFIYMITYNIGQQSVTAATASIVIATAPVMTALLARIFFKEGLTALQWCAIVLEFAGVAALVLIDGELSAGSGLILLILASISISTYNLLQRIVTKKYVPLQATTYSIFFGTIMLAIFLPRSIPELQSAPAINIFHVAFLGIFSSAVAYVSWAKAFSLAPKTSQVSNYMFLTPLLSSILGFVILREIPDAATLIGGGIIILGVLIFNYGGHFTKLLTRSATK